jgi:hypothetical protein
MLKILKMRNYRGASRGRKKTVAGMAGAPTELVTTIISAFRDNDKKQWR